MIRINGINFFLDIVLFTVLPNHVVIGVLLHSLFSVASNAAVLGLTADTCNILHKGILYAFMQNKYDTTFNRLIY